MRETTPQSLLIYGSCDGEFNPAVTPELMQSLGLDIYADDHGDFAPLSEREYDLLCHDDYLTVGGLSVIRFVRAFIKDGVKVINFSDDDYSERETVARTLGNYHESRAVFEKMALAFGVELSADVKNDKDGNISEYWLDIYVPMERFSALNTGQQLVDFFACCTFDSPESIDAAISAVLTQRDWAAR